MNGTEIEQNDAKRTQKRALTLVHPANSGRRIPRLTNLRAVRRELAFVYGEARRGALPLPDACRCAFILTQISRVLVDAELETRLLKLEQAMNSRGAK